MRLRAKSLIKKIKNQLENIQRLSKSIKYIL